MTVTLKTFIDRSLDRLLKIDSTLSQMRRKRKRIHDGVKESTFRSMGNKIQSTKTDRRETILLHDSVVSDCDVASLDAKKNILGRFDVAIDFFTKYVTKGCRGNHASERQNDFKEDCTETDRGVLQWSFQSSKGRLYRTFFVKSYRDTQGVIYIFYYARYWRR